MCLPEKYLLNKIVNQQNIIKMKKFIVIFLMAFSLLFWSNQIYAQSNPPADHGVASNQSGGGAPIGGGLFILLGLGAAYGGKKLYDKRKTTLEE